MIDDDNFESSQEGQKCREIISRQFDLELLHKWREIRILEEEYDRGQQLKGLLEKLVLNEQIYGQALEKSASFAFSQPVSRLSTPMPVSGSSSSLNFGLESPGSKKPRQASMAAMSRTENLLQSEKPSTSSNEPSFLYEMCPDGSLVRLRCPVCGAEKFRSVLGMVNHCRINCGLLVANPDDRIQQCGIPVSPEEVPPEFFQNRNLSQLRRDRELAQIRAGVQAPIIDPDRKPAIREYSENETTTSVVVSSKASLQRKPSQIPSSLATQQESVEALESRFYIRKRILVGNFARRLDNSLSEAEAASREIPTHEWRLYLKPFDPHDDIESYIRGVRFILHPSYKPNDIILVEPRPFELRMTGWGEFPARLEVLFKDPKNKTVEFVHHLRLWSCHSRVFTLMAEQPYDIDLNRKTLHAEKPAEAPAEPPTQAPLTLDDSLALASRFFPLFGAIPKSANITVPQYNRAVSYAEFTKLPLFDQIVLEKERALALQRHLLPSYPDLPLDYVIEWCRRNGLSPSTHVQGESIEAQNDDSREDQKEDSFGLTEEIIKGLLYCRYCGLAHYPQERFEVLQKNCSMRPRKLHLSSRTTATDVISHCKVSPEPLVEAKRPRIIETVLDSPLNRPENWSAEERWVHESLAPLELPAYQPRQQTCQVVLKAAKSFLSDLMKRSAEKLPDSIERAVGRPSILTPLHVYQAITGVVPISAVSSKESKAAEEAAQQEMAASTEPNRFDFLSNVFMAGT